MSKDEDNVTKFVEHVRRTVPIPPSGVLMVSPLNGWSVVICSICAEDVVRKGLGRMLRKHGAIEIGRPVLLLHDYVDGDSLQVH
jgi:hypothetical protein